MSQILNMSDQLWVALVGIIFVSIITGFLSPLIVIKQRSYLTDTFAHLIIPGVVGGIFVSQAFQLEAWLCMGIGATITALCGVYLSEWFLKYLKIPPDASAIICLSAFLALGMLLLSLKKMEDLDPETILFGDVLSLNFNHLALLAFVLLVVAFFVIRYKTHWDAWLTDTEFAAVRGFKIQILNRVFPILLTLAILSGFFAIGGLMIPALMTIPAIFLRPRSSLYYPAIIFSVFLGVLGFFVAHIFAVPIGPTIVFLGILCVIGKTFFLRKNKQKIISN